jgi:hypothetical protein
MDITEEVTVTYTVRDLLAEIRDDVKDVKRDLDNKVDKTEFVQLEADYGIRLGNLESFRWKFAGAMAVAIPASGYVVALMMQ